MNLNKLIFLMVIITANTLHCNPFRRLLQESFQKTGTLTKNVYKRVNQNNDAQEMESFLNRLKTDPVGLKNLEQIIINAKKAQRNQIANDAIALFIAS